MRVVAFSCAHLCSPETQIDLYDHPLDYGPIRSLVELIIKSPPDVVVNLGDFTEPVYGDDDYRSYLPEYETLDRLTRVIKIAGNHDPTGEDFVVLDGVRYEHGHKDFLDRHIHRWFETKEAYNEHVREGYWGKILVHGHTHFPHEAWPLDVGSITHSRTYGEITGGVPRLVRL